MAAPGFWDAPEAARTVIDESNRLKAWVEPWSELSGQASDLTALAELLEAEDDVELAGEFDRGLDELEQGLQALELRTMLQGEDDHREAIVTIHPGAGGTESQDWAEMLMRMYTRWAERHGYGVNMLDLQPGQEAGIKSATFEIHGESAYGYLKAERGVHRLVRISPFDAQKRRHTSFASVFVYPLVEDDIEIEIDEGDLRVDTFRASGAGGQHVNKTDSAIRITHLPSGIIVECQDERSQHKNRARAMSLLAARILEGEQRKQREAEAASRKSQVGTGDRSDRVRTYNFPQGRVTDHRINLTLYKIERIMDGELDDLIGPLIAEEQAGLLAALADH
jgi:peptide chain release factor 2